jgi:hypothetical protein
MLAGTLRGRRRWQSRLTWPYLSVRTAANRTSPWSKMDWFSSRCVPTVPNVFKHFMFRPIHAQVLNATKPGTWGWTCASASCTTSKRSASRTARTETACVLKSPLNGLTLTLCRLDVIATSELCDKVAIGQRYSFLGRVRAKPQISPLLYKRDKPHKASADLSSIMVCICSHSVADIA